MTTRDNTVNPTTLHVGPDATDPALSSVYGSTGEGRTVMVAGPYVDYASAEAYRVARQAETPDQGALFDMPAARPLNAIAEGR